jgi:hypothetical protein
MCPDTVTLYNYIGETSGQAVYARTVLKGVCVDDIRGVIIRSGGDARVCKAMLFIFDRRVRSDKEQLAYEAWKALPATQKAQYWTLSDNGRDRFCVGESTSASPPENSYKINGVDRMQRSGPRLWHWEVSGSCGKVGARYE